MLKHWEHTEIVDSAQLSFFQKNGRVIEPKIVIPYNTAVYVSDGSKRLEGIYDPVLKGIRPLKDKTSPNRDLRLYNDALQSEHITLLAVDGLMGTGKTSTAVEYVIEKHLSSLKTNHDKEIDEVNRGDHKILIAKPHVNAAGEEYGHLPGDIEEKFNPTLSNFIQYFDRFHQAGYHALSAAGYVEVLPMGFIRGLDADNITIIADECQNTRELITVATRRAKRSRIIFLGDTSPFQIDVPTNSPEKNGLSELIDLLAGAPYFQYIEMKTLEHIVRSEEVRDIVRRLFRKYGQDPKQWII